MKLVNKIDDITIVAQKVGRILADKTLTVVTAESCTGGGIAYALTAVPGAAQWFDQGFVTYSNSAKQTLLSVPKNIIDDHGAVSQETAFHMAKGALKNSTSNISIAVTGIAGPSGGSKEKPVGTVWFGFGFGKNVPHIETVCQIFTGGRQAVREKTILFALENLYRLLHINNFL